MAEDVFPLSVRDCGVPVVYSTVVYQWRTARRLNTTTPTTHCGTKPYFSFIMLINTVRGGGEVIICVIRNYSDGN